MEAKDGQIIDQYVHHVRDFSASLGTKMSASFNPRSLIGPPKDSLRASLFLDPVYTGLKSCCLRWWKEALSPPEEFVKQKGKICGQDFVEVSFKHRVYPQEVLVFETYNPGALVKIWALGPMSWELLWEGKPAVLDQEISHVSPPIKQVDFPTQILRLEFKHQVLPYYTELNAVLLRGRKPTMGNIIRPISFSKISRPSIGQGTLLSSELGAKCEEVSSSNSVDVSDFEGPQVAGFDSLPDEMVLKVFEYLDMPTLCRSAQVNKQFYRVASDATLHKCMNFRPYWHSLRSEALLTLATKCRLLQKLDLSWCGSHLTIEPVSVKCFLEKCGANLTHMRMNNCKFVDDSVLEAIVRYAPNLEELSLRSVTVCTGWSVLENLEKLKRLDLYGTNIDTEAATAVVMSNPGLTHLNLGCCKRISDMDEVAQALASNCPEIISVDLLNVKNFTRRGNDYINECKKLQKLSVGVCYMSVTRDDSSKASSSDAVVLHRLYL